MLHTPAFTAENDIGKKKEQLEEFLVNIFAQPLEKAYRRNRFYWGERYERKQRIGMQYCLLYSFRISSAYFLTDTFLVRFFSRFSRPLAPMAFSSSLPALSINQRRFSSTLSYSPGSQHRPPLVSSIMQRISEPDSKTPITGLAAEARP